MQTGVGECHLTSNLTFFITAISLCKWFCLENVAEKWEDSCMRVYAVEALDTYLSRSAHDSLEQCIKKYLCMFLSLLLVWAHSQSTIVIMKIP